MAFKFQHVRFLIPPYATNYNIIFFKRFHQFKHLLSLGDSINFSNLEHFDLIEENIKSRKTTSNIKLIKSILNQLETISSQRERQLLLVQLKNELWKLPNQTHPDCLNYGDEPKELAKYNELPHLESNSKNFSEIAKKLNIFRMDHLGNFNGHKSYYLMDSLAELEHGLIRYTIDTLKKEQFKLISVPDILPAGIIEGCGMQTTGERNQVYRLKSNGKCLSGTSEMALAGYFKNNTIKETNLPIKLAAVSRCFRAETSGLHEEKGIYRVHQFTKVEMFSVCTKDQSEETLQSFKNIEIELFQKLGIHFKLLDMPPCELGAPAYRKYDIEAWMPGRKMWGEISSCSNCTDYQAKRLGITYQKSDGTLDYVHTVNGTACAIPRLLIALLETFQDKDGGVKVPQALHEYLNNTKEITRKKKIPDLKLVKHIDNPSLS